MVPTAKLELERTPQPVGFVTFHTRAGAEAAKQDLQVTIKNIIKIFTNLIENKNLSI